MSAPSAKAEGDREADVAEVEHGRMNDHLRVLEQRIEAVAVFGDGARSSAKGGAAKLRTARKKTWMRGQDGAGVGVQLDVCLVGEAEDESVGSQQPGPEEQRAFLAAPQGGKLVGAGEGAVGVLQDVSDGEIVGKDGPDEREGRGGDGHEDRRFRRGAPYRPGVRARWGRAARWRSSAGPALLPARL